MVADGHGLPLGVTLSPGQQHESTVFEQALGAVRLFRRRRRRRPRRPAKLAGDKGYSFRRIRRWLQRHRITAVIPQRSDQEGRPDGCKTFDRKTYRQRNVVERCIGWLKECRRIATRYDKLALSFKAMLQWAMVRRYLKAVFSDTP